MTARRPAGDGVIVFVGGERWDGVRGSHRQLAEALSRHRLVLYVDDPVSPVAARRAGAAGRRPSGLRFEGPDLAVVVPAAPPGLTRPGLRQVTRWMQRRAIRRALAELGDPVVEALIVASLDDLLTSCRAGVRLVYATDDYVAGAALMHQSAAHLERDERRQAARADGVIVVSDDLAARWRALGHDPVVVPNGCDIAAYRGVVDRTVTAADVPLAAPIAGVVGRVTSRIDLALLEGVADRERSLLLVGPLDPGFEPERVAGLLARPNVHWAGAQRFEDLPPYLAAMRVGLTPYADSAFNRASFPLKTLEYLAAGLDVVATDLPAHRQLPAGAVTLASGPAAYADAVDAALDAPVSADAIAGRRAVAEANSWDERAGRVMAMIGRRPTTSAPAAAAVGDGTR